MVQPTLSSLPLHLPRPISLLITTSLPRLSLPWLTPSLFPCFITFLLLFYTAQWKALTFEAWQRWKRRAPTNTSGHHIRYCLALFITSPTHQQPDSSPSMPSPLPFIFVPIHLPCDSSLPHTQTPPSRFLPRTEILLENRWDPARWQIMLGL